MIFFDLSFIRQDIHSGVAKYAYRILDYIVATKQQERFTLVVNYISQSHINNKYPEFNKVVIGSNLQSRLPIIRTFILSLQFRNVVNKSGVNTVFCPWANFITFLPNKANVISVIHDMQHLIDLKGMGRNAYKFMYDMIFRNSKCFVTITEFSKKQILSFYPSEGNRVYNLGNSVSMCSENLPKRLIEGDYLLFVGRICALKNVITLVKAFIRIKDIYPSLKLVLVGSKNAYYESSLKPLISNTSVENRIIIVTGCSEPELSALYRDAKLFVFPSLREGFGFPPIEAAYLKVPVISSKCDSLEEATMGLVNYYNNPMDDAELAEKIQYILNNYPKVEQLEMIKKKYIENYSTDVVGKRIVDFIYGQEAHNLRK